MSQNLRQHFAAFALPIVLCFFVHAGVFAGSQNGRTVTEKDMPRIPHTEVNDAMTTFRLAQGFSLEMK